MTVEVVSSSDHPRRIPSASSLPWRPSGAPLRAHAVAPAHFAREGDAYRFGVAPLKVEVLTKISGVSFDDGLRGSKTFELDGYQIPYIGKAPSSPTRRRLDATRISLTWKSSSAFRRAEPGIASPRPLLAARCGDRSHSRQRETGTGTALLSMGPTR
jgi:hypothetical protein